MLRLLSDVATERRAARRHARRTSRVAWRGRDSGTALTAAVAGHVAAAVAHAAAHHAAVNQVANQLIDVSAAVAAALTASCPSRPLTLMAEAATRARSLGRLGRLNVVRHASRGRRRRVVHIEGVAVDGGIHHEELDDVLEGRRRVVAAEARRYERLEGRARRLVHGLSHAQHLHHAEATAATLPHSLLPQQAPVGRHAAPLLPLLPRVREAQRAVDGERGGDDGDERDLEGHRVPVRRHADGVEGVVAHADLEHGARDEAGGHHGAHMRRPAPPVVNEVPAQRHLCVIAHNSAASAAGAAIAIAVSRLDNLRRTCERPHRGVVGDVRMQPRAGALVADGMARGPLRQQASCRYRLSHIRSSVRRGG
mmetsp:Transcript_13303/g.46525  ORF Transcript_13303/g.46525 Transcript_13303/m.46525 type:complete len:367 (-) Transcript_13303:152-1252(-)